MIIVVFNYILLELMVLLFVCNTTIIGCVGEDQYSARFY